MLPYGRQASGSRCASKMNIKCTLQGTKVCVHFVATVRAVCADSPHRSVASDMMMINLPCSRHGFATLPEVLGDQNM